MSVDLFFGNTLFREAATDILAHFIGHGLRRIWVSIAKKLSL